MRVRELTRPREVASACGGDTLLVWTAQGMRGGVRAWALGEAVAVASPDLNRRDRLAVGGPADRVVTLLRWVLPEISPSYRLLAERSLVAELAVRVPRAEAGASFEWMDMTGPPPSAETVAGAAEEAAEEAVGEAVGEAGWLCGADEEVTDLLAEASPSAWAVPGVSGIHRWAGLRSDGGGLVATAADAWSCPEVGFVAGVATAPAWRGRGYGERVCRFVFGELAAAHGRVALMVDTDNRSAIGLYERLGMRGRSLSVLALPGGS